MSNNNTPPIKGEEDILSPEDQFSENDFNDLDDFANSNIDDLDKEDSSLDDYVNVDNDISESSLGLDSQDNDVLDDPIGDLDDLDLGNLENDDLSTLDDLNISVDEEALKKDKESIETLEKDIEDLIIPQDDEDDYEVNSENEDDNNFSIDSKFNTGSFFSSDFTEIPDSNSPFSYEMDSSLLNKVKFTDEEFLKFTLNIERLPLKLKQGVYNLIISEEYLAEDVSSIINSIIGNDSAFTISKKLKRITGEDIVVPRNYVKKLGFEYELEKKQFPYRYKEEVLPLAKLIGGISLLFIFIFIMSYLYIFKPVYANYFYSEGIKAIRENKFTLVENYFEQAYTIWPDSNKLVEYASEYVKKRQYTRAYDKYVKLLGVIGEQEPRRKYENGINPEDKTGIYNFAEFLADSYKGEDDSNYVLARAYIRRLIRKDRKDYMPLLAQGDLYIKWGDFISDDHVYRKALYEQARISYAEASRLNPGSKVIQSMLKYLIRVDDYDTVQKIEGIFMSPEKYKEIDWDIFLQVTDYYIEKHRSTKDLNKTYEILVKAMEIQPDNPRVYYNLARYYVLMNTSFKKDDKREDAAKKAIELLDNLKVDRSLKSEEFLMKLDSLRILARHYRDKKNYFNSKDILDNTPSSNLVSHKEALLRFQEVQNNIDLAKENFVSAIKTYEESLARDTIKKSKEFGSLYYELGNIFYEIDNDYQTAKNYFLLAIDNHYDDKSLEYKLGYILYSQQDYEGALKRFYKSQSMFEGVTENMSLLISIANSNYIQKNYEQAIANYRILSKELDINREKEGNFNPRGDETNKKLLKYQVIMNNNLGVSYIKLVQNNYQNGYNYLSKGLDYLRIAQQKSVDYLRDPITEQRSPDFTISQSNLSKALDIEELSDVDYTIYEDIPKDLALIDFERL